MTEKKVVDSRMRSEPRCAWHGRQSPPTPRAIKDNSIQIKAVCLPPEVNRDTDDMIIVC